MIIVIKFEFKMSKIKILILGPQKAGKSTIANILGDL
jgi:GTPase SAR1 family protein